MNKLVDCEYVFFLVIHLLFFKIFIQCIQDNIVYILYLIICINTVT